MGLERKIELTCAACGGRQRRLDELTGLDDRASFREALAVQVAAPAEALGREGRAGPGFAVLMIDLDRFKAVNDTLGHTAGDMLLAAVGRRLRRVVRASDVVARLGGDEFAILLSPPADAEVVTRVASRLIELLGQPFIIDGRTAHVGASAGAVLAGTGDALDAETLMRHADLALYAAKEGGRGRFGFFEAELQRRAEAARAMESDLRAALVLDQFELFYQPQMSLERDRLAGFEALIRWRHPVRGLVQPDSFIGLAEKLGLITGIGDWVIATACREAATWPGDLSVAVNVAARQFDDGRLLRTVEAALQASGLPAARLELEVTETAMLRQGPDVMEQMGALKALGVMISLDDFGTGYSSLTQLRSFDFDRVKIDRSFVDNVAVVRAIAALGRSLGMRTTAEGIETPVQMARLRDDGCTEIQGYLLSRPVPTSELGALIEHLGGGGASHGRHPATTEISA